MGDPVKAVGILLATCLFAGCAYAMPRDKIIGKQVRLPHHRQGMIVGRSEGGFIIIPAKSDQIQAASPRANQVARR
jgi:hypothetical protein